MSRESDNRYNGIALPITEVSTLKEIEESLRKHGALREEEAIPLVSKDKMAFRESNTGFCVENAVITGLSMRYCALPLLPDSLGQFPHLQHLDVTGNSLLALPESVGNLLQMKRLFADDNRLTVLPGLFQLFGEANVDSEKSSQLSCLSQQRKRFSRKFMSSSPLFPLPDGLEVTSVSDTPEEVLVRVTSYRATSSCPLCSIPSSAIHSLYRRHPKDLPCVGRPIRLLLTVRKFFCRNPSCVRKIFTERLPELIEVSSRLTKRLRGGVQEIGFATCGKGGERLSSKLGIKLSDVTLLRSLYLLPLPPIGKVTVLGIDDWSYRRGKRYGSILVNLQTQKIIDLLPERSVESVIAWLEAHPEVEIVSRDRGGTYVDGVTQGAPLATQVCDRWHLLKNLGEAIEAFLIRAHIRLPEAVVQEPTQERPLTTYSATPAQQGRTQARLLRKWKLYQRIHELHEGGMSLRKIGEELGVARNTVRKYFRQPPEPPLPTPRPLRASKLDRYEDYILTRLSQGCTNAAQIYREITEMGFTGGHTNVRAYVAHLRKSTTEGRTPAKRSERAHAISPRALRWLLTRDRTELDQEEQVQLDQLLQASSEVRVIHPLLQTFHSLVRERKYQQLRTWMEDAGKSGICELKSFVAGIERDYDAVKEALRLPWSQGITEGKVNKLKTIKRQMYGRAGFPLLRQRLLHDA